MSNFRTAFLTSVPFALLMAASSPAAAADAVLSDGAIQLSDNYAASLNGANPNDAPISFSADSMTRDETSGTITAHGHVEMEQAGRILKADQVVYNINNGKMNAVGHVVMLDANGDVHLADTIDLSDQMKVANATNMRSTMKDGSRMWAENGERIAKEKTTLTEAAYTPCEPCLKNPDKPPIWQIKAGEVKHDELEHSIVYKNATFDAFGVPILYMPYFKHPDGTIAQKSGFLTPSFGYKSRQGAMITNSYYWGISPYEDATFGITAMTAQAPLAFAEYRKRYDNAQIKVNTSMTYSTRVDDVNGNDVIRDEQTRGHFFAKSLYDIDNKWRAGLNVEYASDDQYLRQYGFSDKDVLEDQLYVERFSGRDYAVGRMMAFQDLRTQSQKTDQPAVLPQISANFLGEPAALLGGRWSFDASTLGLLRTGSGQDLNRLTAEGGWQRRLVSDTGLLTKVDFSLRGDAYYVADRQLDAAVYGSDSTTVRGFAQGNIVTSYPVIRPLGEHSHAVLEPMVALTVSPTINPDNHKIPNEDSQDVQLDVSNLFEPNRFPGYDRIEDKIHATYGLRSGVYGDQGSKGEVFVGQSYRLSQSGNPFPGGSGLDTQYSDLVGQITANYKNRYSLDYKFELDSNDYTARRHEVGAGLNLNRLQFGVTYLFARPIAGTTLLDNREQIAGTASYALSDSWKVRTSATEDLGKDRGLRNALFGVDYLGQCFNVTGNLQRNLTDDSSGTSSTVVVFRLGLKNLGQFSTSGINLDNKTSSSSTSPSAK
ncbi:MAG: organic solvent tolerance family protein [Micavibrio sp.]|nr:organic solvent tolerance family protein [Micavibrio sp.]